MMEVDIYNTILSYTNARPAGKGWMKFNCPCCTSRNESRPDTKERGNILDAGGGEVVYNCYNCHFKTKYVPGENLSNGMIFLMEHIGIPSDDIKKIKFEVWRNKEKLRKSGKKDSEPLNIGMPVFTPTKMPAGAKSFSYWANLDNPPADFLDVMQYVYGRGDHIFNSHTYYWSPGDKSIESEEKWFMNKRVIIPYYWNKKIVGWNARIIDDELPTPRYRKESQSDYLFNNHVIDSRKRQYIIVVEGEFDAIAIDGVSPLGNQLTPKQVLWLKRTGKTPILVGDRERKNSNFVDFALKYDLGASFPVWEHDVKDVADAVQRYGRLFTLKTIIDNISTRSRIAFAAKAAAKGGLTRVL